ncbi:MAG: T9SS type A sorting domain-containing protein [Bacteroidota bacterium]|nr:T9SS type A sorting domain-containing protein [Bacteroidota bacterium]
MIRRIFTGFISFFVICIMITSCLTFDSVLQPTDAVPDSYFEVEIAVRSSGGLILTSGYVGVALPEGWLVQNNKIPFTGDYQGTIFYSNALSYQMEQLDPAPAGYYWWVGKGPESTSGTDDRYIGTMTIINDDKEGTFYLDYMLGNSNDGLNQDRSNNHRISIVATGSEESEREEFRVYPLRGELVIKPPAEKEISEIMVFDMNGRMLRRKAGSQHNYRIPLFGINDKILIVKLLDSENQAFTKKIILP